MSDNTNIPRFFDLRIMFMSMFAGATREGPDTPHYRQMLQARPP